MDFLEKTAQTGEVMAFRKEELAPSSKIEGGLDLFGLLSAYPLIARGDVNPRTLDFYSLIHVIEGHAWFWTEPGGRAVVTAGQAVLVSPAVEFDFAAATDGATIDCICFSGVFAEQLQLEGLLEAGILQVGTARRLLPVIRCVSEDTHEGRLRARSVWLHLFTELSIEQQTVSGTSSRIAPLIAVTKQHPEIWRDGKQMAAFCHISEAQLRRIFKKETGLSPKMFQDTVRAEKAASLLKSGFSVNVVSEVLGYSDPFHFSRRFKTLIGKSPRDYLSGQ